MQEILLLIRLTDKLKNENGEEVKLDEPTGFELPPKVLHVEDAGYQAPAEDGSRYQGSGKSEIRSVCSYWNRLPPGKEQICKDLKLLIKAKENVQPTISRWLVHG